MRKTKYSLKNFNKVWKGPEIGLMYSDCKFIKMPFVRKDGTYDPYPYEDNLTSSGISWLGGLFDRLRAYGTGLATVGIRPSFKNLWIGLYKDVRKTERFMLNDSQIANERGQNFTGSDEVYIDIGEGGFESELAGALNYELKDVKLINLKD